MSDTPRSDDAEDKAKERYENFREAGWPAFGDVGFDFARQLERELNEQRAKVRNLAAWLDDIYELGADSMSVGLAANALNGEPHDETEPTET